MKRLFVAIDFPESLKKQLSELCYGVPNAKWTSKEQFHLTLRFIGEVQESLFEEIRGSLFSVKVPPFELVLKGIGCFPLRREPKVLWVGVHKNEVLLQLRNKIERKLISLGIEAEGQKFSPHVTLARLSGTPGSRLEHFFAGNGLFKTETIGICEFKLYSSFLSSNGAIHTVEESYKL